LLLLLACACARRLGGYGHASDDPKRVLREVAQRPSAAIYAGHLRGKPQWDEGTDAQTYAGSAYAPMSTKTTPVSVASSMFWRRTDIPARRRARTARARRTARSSAGRLRSTKLRQRRRRRREGWGGRGRSARSVPREADPHGQGHEGGCPHVLPLCTGAAALTCCTSARELKRRAAPCRTEPHFGGAGSRAGGAPPPSPTPLSARPKGRGGKMVSFRGVLQKLMGQALGRPPRPTLAYTPRLSKAGAAGGHHKLHSRLDHGAARAGAPGVQGASARVRWRSKNLGARSSSRSEQELGLETLRCAVLASRQRLAPAGCAVAARGGAVCASQLSWLVPPVRPRAAAAAAAARHVPRGRCGRQVENAPRPTRHGRRDRSEGTPA
ncbi:unnamed protein product, partial [Prorocentrum cordatum]